MANHTINFTGSTCELSNIELEKDEAFPKLPHFDTIKRLIIKESTIPCLTEDILGSFPNIEYFWGIGNGIEKVSEDAFVGCQHLKVIDLNSNQIKELKMNTFNRNPSLTILNLSNNQLTCLPKELFSNLNNLEVLDLSSNKLTSLSKKLFNDLKSLKNFYISYNGLLDLKLEKLIEQAPNSDYLYLYDNDFTVQRMREIVAICEGANIYCPNIGIPSKMKSRPCKSVMVKGFPCVPDTEHALLMAKKKITKLKRKVEEMQKENELLKLSLAMKEREFQQNRNQTSSFLLDVSELQAELNWTPVQYKEVTNDHLTLTYDVDSRYGCY